MPQTDERLKSMYLSGTVSIPPRFPELGDITFSFLGTKAPQLLVEVTSVLSPKLTIKRSFFADDVSCIFEPDDTGSVDLNSGKWYNAPEVRSKATAGLNKPAIKGIVYVRENAPSLLDVQAGLTAAESAEYYPPLPDDRSVNHYSMEKNTSGVYQQYGAPGCPF